MSLTTAARRRPLVRGLAAGLVVAACGLLGAPAAAAAEDGRPVISLDPPDVEVFLIPEENGDMLAWSETLAADAPAAAALAEAAAAMPPEVVSALGARAQAGMEGQATEGAVATEYGGTVELQLPDVVDASAVRFTLDVLPPDPDDLPRRYRSPVGSDQPLTVAPLGGNEFGVTLPAAAAGYGPEALLTVDRLTMADTGAELLFPLTYFLEFTGPGVSTVPLAPTVGLFSNATCSIEAWESCPGPTVRAGKPVDLVIPPDSLLRTFGFAQLDTAFYGLDSMSDEEPYQSFDSQTNPDLVNVHGPSAATLRVPADARPATYMGYVVQGGPSAGVAVTSFELDVAAVPVNPGLYSDTGWVEEVREVSPASTAAVAGGAFLLVGGLVTVVAVRPGRRPPLGG